RQGGGRGRPDASHHGEGAPEGQPALPLAIAGPRNDVEAVNRHSILMRWTTPAPAVAHAAPGVGSRLQYRRNHHGECRDGRAPADLRDPSRTHGAWRRRPDRARRGGEPTGAETHVRVT